MHFQLPEQLRDSLLEYDAVLKPLAIAKKREQAAERKTTFPLGLPNDLIPYDICSEDEQLKIVQDTNRVPAKDRHFQTSNQNGAFVIMHHESAWYGVWLYNPTHKNAGQYVYGVKVAYKSNNTTTNKVGYVRIGRSTNDNHLLTHCADMESVKYGRQMFFTKAIRVTRQMIIDGCDLLPFNLIDRWAKKSREAWRSIDSFLSVLKMTIPTWDDDTTFGRIAENGDILKLLCDSNHEKLSFDEEFVIKRSTVNDPAWIRTPYFRREIRNMMEATLCDYNNNEITEKKIVRRHYRKFLHRIGRVYDFINIYENASLDHIQAVYEISAHLESFNCRNAAARSWIAENMPIGSFVTMLQKFVAGRKEEWQTNERLVHSDMHYSTLELCADFRDLTDTFDMMNQIHKSQAAATRDFYVPLQLEKPSRWRITEFHDHVAAEAFKAVTPNEKLIQGLFPQPVKVSTDDSNWTFFQPNDIHQLALWGKVVRNCVGSAGSYKEGIKKKTHFIVLAMIDGKPRMTIQLRVSNGIMNVDQIRDVSNKILSDEQHQLYSRAFSEALAVRASQI